MRGSIVDERKIRETVRIVEDEKKRIAEWEAMSSSEKNSAVILKITGTVAFIAFLLLFMMVCSGYEGPLYTPWPILPVFLILYLLGTVKPSLATIFISSITHVCLVIYVGTRIVNAIELPDPSQFIVGIIGVITGYLKYRWSPRR